MSKLWFTSDWHLGEDRFAIMDRPFTNTDEHIDFLVEQHNKLVAPEDTVWNLGDICYQNHPEYLNHVARFNGTKHMVRGNHDRVFTDEQLLQYFETVVPEGQGVDMNVEGVDCYLNHYPTLGKQDKFNLSGHIHGGWKLQLNMVNVGVDVHHFRPIPATAVPFYLKAIQEFYDFDMWAAYDPINASYEATRGKKSYYFPREAVTAE